MNYIKLIDELQCEVVKNNFTGDIENINMDSRKITNNGCFVAISGMTVDGHNYIQKAYENGARVFVIEKDVNIEFEDVTIIKVENSRIAMAKMAKKLKNMKDSLKLIGVTGTNGKTSTTYFITHILNYLKKKTLSIGTLGVKVDNEEIDLPISASTTPEFTELMDILEYSENKGIENVAMEVSSHSLELYKVYGLTFDVSVFTNLTQDHLDFHETMENYLQAKCKLFNQSKVSVINMDDSYSKEVLASCTGKVVTYSIDNPSDYQAKNVVLNDISIEFDLNIDGKEQHFKVNVPAKFTVYNTLASVVAILNLNSGFSASEIAEALETCGGVPGRVETIKSNKGFSLLIDYAHTPDALEKVIETVRETTKGKIITVFGCGGDRDAKKRPIMGEIATRLSDYTIITSDNPRTEDPFLILDDVEKGVANKKYEKIEDRENAIKRAIMLAEDGDKVIIAGKGHENYQIIMDKKIYFSDLETAKKFLGDN